MKPTTGIIRDRAYLNWRYVQYPQYAHRLLGVYLRGRLSGWLVLTEDNFNGQPREEVRILDHLIPSAIFHSVLAHLASDTLAGSVVFWLPQRLWNGESRRTNWIAICMSNVTDHNSKQLASDLHYGLGEVDQWWW